MIGYVLLALGLVLILEGLAWALAPSFIERALMLLAALTGEQRRQVGFLAAAIGAVLVWAAAVLIG